MEFVLGAVLPLICDVAAHRTFFAAGVGVVVLGFVKSRRADVAIVSIRVKFVPGRQYKHWD